MKVVVWIIQVLVALAFLITGAMKLMTPYEEMIANPQMAWANDFSAMQIKLISILEILGALGLIIPMFVGKLKMLVPISAIGLALIMVGAAITHIGREEPVMVPIILFVLAAFTAWFRRDLFGKSQ